MLSLSHVQRIFLARSQTDMRKQAIGLAGMVVDALGKDPLSAERRQALFVMDRSP